jgi:hypothetical protein
MQYLAVVLDLFCCGGGRGAERKKDKQNEEKDKKSKAEEETEEAEQAEEGFERLRRESLLQRCNFSVYYRKYSSEVIVSSWR